MKKPLKIFSFISVAGILIWLSNEFHGGMAIYALMYPWLIIPLTLGFGITLIQTISNVIQHGLRNNIISATIHFIGLLAISTVSLMSSEFLKSDTILEAILIDDLNSIKIKLRTDNTFYTTVEGMFGFVDRISGDYHLEQDTIIFHQPPYSNNFIPNEILIDKSDSALYFNRLTNGEFDRTKSFVNYFEIRKIKL